MKRVGYLLLLVFCALVFAKLFGPYLGSVASKDPPFVKTNNEIEKIRTAVASYQEAYRRLPSTASNADFTKDLLRRKVVSAYNSHPFLELPDSNLNSQQEIVDGWGTPFRISRLKTNQIIIESAGADEKWDTRDDIHERIYP